MEKQKSKNDDWVKVPSKTRPGRYYLFNRTTGETQWVSPGKDNKGEGASTSKLERENEAPPKVLNVKQAKTPAQDRLKRLQHDIRLERVKKETKQPSHQAEAKPKSKKSKPSTDKPREVAAEKTGSLKAKTSLPSSPARPSKRQHIEDPHSSSKEEIKRKIAKKPLAKKISSEIQQKTKSAQPSTSKKEIKSVTSKAVPASKNIASNSEPGIFSKLKTMLTLPFNAFKTNTAEVPARENKEPISLHKSVVHSALSELRAEQKKIDSTNILHKSLEASISSQSIPSSSLVLEALSELRTEQNKLRSQGDGFPSPATLVSNKTIPPSIVSNALSEVSKQPKNLQNRGEKKTLKTSSANASMCSTPKNLSIPNYQRGSANSRLDRLRQSLMHQQQSSTSLNSSTATPHHTLPAMPVTTPISTSPNSPFINIAQNINNSCDDEIEPMDWQPTENEQAVKVSPTEYVSSNSSAAKPKQTADTMGEIYDTVSENLLRLSAENNRDSYGKSRKWLKEFYYFVVDTNVLLECLSFLEDISKLQLCDTQGSILFIPYGVLQELDKLKMRSGCKEGVKTLAVRAIKYLNKKFENNNLNLQAQTAIEERRHLIDVNSADDSIINCCLQAKEHVPNLVLLTEDVNLRNKAICNNILVTTKSDLLCKRYDNATNGKSTL